MTTNGTEARRSRPTSAGPPPAPAERTLAAATNKRPDLAGVHSTPHRVGRNVLSAAHTAFQRSAPAPKEPPYAHAQDRLDRPRHLVDHHAAPAAACTRGGGGGRCRRSRRSRQSPPQAVPEDPDADSGTAATATPTPAPTATPPHPDADGQAHAHAATAVPTQTRSRRRRRSRPREPTPTPGPVLE